MGNELQSGKDDNHSDIKPQIAQTLALLHDNRINGATAGKVICEVLTTKTIRRLDLSNQYDMLQTTTTLDDSFWRQFSRGLWALTYLDLRGNYLGKLALPPGWKDNGPRMAYFQRYSCNGTYVDANSPPEGSKPSNVIIVLMGAIRTNTTLRTLRLGANNWKGFETGRLLGEALAVNTVLRELDLSGGPHLRCDLCFFEAFSDGLRINKALTSLDISNNNLGPKSANMLSRAIATTGVRMCPELMVLPLGWTPVRQCFRSPEGKYQRESPPLRRCTFQPGHNGRCMCCNNPKNQHHVEGAMVTVNVVGNSIGKVQLLQLQEMQSAHPTLVTLCGINVDATTADLSNHSMDADDADILAGELSNHTALEFVNILGNPIGIKQAQKLGTVLRKSPTLSSLCGNKGNERTLVMSHNMNRAEDAILFASELVCVGKTSLDISNNNVSQPILPDGWRAKYGNGVSPWVHQDGREYSGDWPEGSKMLGIIAICDVLPYVGRLVRFDISNNALRAEGGKVLAEALNGNKVLTELNIANNYFSAGASWNVFEKTDMSGVMAIIHTISTLGALKTLRMGGNGLIGVESGNAFGYTIASHTVLQELDLSTSINYFKCDAEFTKGLAIGLGANRVLTSLNISNNKVGNLVSVNGWSYEPDDIWKGYWHADGRKTKTKPEGEEFKAEGVLALADAIKKNEVLTSLNLSKNTMRGAEAGKAFAAAFAANKTLRELDLSGQPETKRLCASHSIDTDFAKELTVGTLKTVDIRHNWIGTEGANALITDLKRHDTITSFCTIPIQALQDNRIAELDIRKTLLGLCEAIILNDYIKRNTSLSKLTFGGDTYYTDNSGETRELSPEPAILEVGMREANFSEKNLGIGGAFIVSAWISHKDSGSLTSLNMSNNHIVHTSPNVWVLNSYNTGDLVEYDGIVCPVQDAHPDHSGGWYRVYMMHGIVALADTIKNSDAIIKFDISNNNIGTEGGKVFAIALKGHKVLQELRISDRSLGGEPYKTLDTIPTMGALRRLDICNHHFNFTRPSFKRFVSQLKQYAITQLRPPVIIKGYNDTQTTDLRAFFVASQNQVFSKVKAVPATFRTMFTFGAQPMAIVTIPAAKRRVQRTGIGGIDALHRELIVHIVKYL